MEWNLCQGWKDIFNIEPVSNPKPKQRWLLQMNLIDKNRIQKLQLEYWNHLHLHSVQTFNEKDDGWIVNKIKLHKCRWSLSRRRIKQPHNQRDSFIYISWVSLQQHYKYYY